MRVDLSKFEKFPKYLNEISQIYKDSQKFRFKKFKEIIDVWWLDRRIHSLKIFKMVENSYD